MSTELGSGPETTGLVQRVQETVDATIATCIGVPRSTVDSWLKRAPQVITTVSRPRASPSALRLLGAKFERTSRA